MDMETSRIIRSILLKLKDKGKTVIVSSHILETLTNMCDFIHLLEDGRIKNTIVKDKFKDFENEIFSSIKDKNKKLLKELID